MSLQDKLNQMLNGGQVQNPLYGGGMYTYKAESISRESNEFSRTWLEEIIPSIISSLRENMHKPFDYKINKEDLAIYIKPNDSETEKVEKIDYNPDGVISVKPSTGNKEKIYSNILVQAGYNINKAGNKRTINWKLNRSFDKDEYVKTIVNEIIVLAKNLGVIKEENIEQLLTPMDKNETTPPWPGWIKNPDGSYDVNGDVTLPYGDLVTLPWKFRKVTGYFDVHRNNLTSLEGCPKEVGAGFDCAGNNLRSLKGCPEKVGWNTVHSYFDCSNNWRKFEKIDVTSRCKVNGRIHV
jgi:hypothetical protein